MTEAEAKHVIKNDYMGNIKNRLDAIATAQRALGENCTMEDIWRWAGESDSGDDRE